MLDWVVMGLDCKGSKIFSHNSAGRIGISLPPRMWFGIVTVKSSSFCPEDQITSDFGGGEGIKIPTLCILSTVLTQLFPSFLPCEPLPHSP